MGTQNGGHGPARALALAEEARLKCQTRLDAERTQSERNGTGQFATPTALAADIAAYVAGMWGNRDQRVRFLEPALGTGSFFSALMHVFPVDMWAWARGVEVDPRFVKVARDIWTPFGLEVIHADFTRLEPPRSDEERANLIVTNPPYVRHHHLDASTKTRLRQAVASRLGVQISGLAGLYCYFLLLADSWLARNGLSAWLIPTEFLTVNYGAAVRRYLTERVSLLLIHAFDARDVQFGDALVSSAVVVFEKVPPGPGHTVTLSTGGTLLKPAEVRQVPLTRLRRSSKWLSLLSAEDSESDREVTLSTLFKIKRGIATGSNSFFIMTRSAAIKRGIPEECLRPVLPSPRHLKETIIQAEPDGYPALPQQLVVIDCPLPESVVKERYPALWAYLAEGKAAGIAEGYLARRRDPWYRQENREPAPFLCTYMGRGREGGAPFRFIWNKSQAVVTNVYLALYPIGEMAEALKIDPSLYPAVFELLNEISPADLKSEGRVYGGGLHKMEPAELGRVPAAKFVKLIRHAQTTVSGWVSTQAPSLFDPLPSQGT